MTRLLACGRVTTAGQLACIYLAPEEAAQIVEGVCTFYGVGVMSALTPLGAAGYEMAQNNFRDEIHLFEEVFAEMQSQRTEPVQGPLTSEEMYPVREDEVGE